MKKYYAILIIILGFCAKDVFGQQRLTAIPSRTQYFNVDYTFRDLHLKSNLTNDYYSSHMIGLTHKGVGQNLVYMEHLGYTRWEDNVEQFGLYTRGTVMYRNFVDNPWTNHDLQVGIGMTANFEFGSIDGEGYMFAQAGPIVGLYYQIPDKGFNLYVFSMFEFIVMSQLGNEDLGYADKSFIGLGFGLEYLIPNTNYNFGVEFAFIRESSFVIYFGSRL